MGERSRSLPRPETVVRLRGDSTGDKVLTESDLLYLTQVSSEVVSWLVRRTVTLAVKFIISVKA